jgi:hypothetical protein
MDQTRERRVYHEKGIFGFQDDGGVILFLYPLPSLHQRRMRSLATHQAN